MTKKILSVFIIIVLALSLIGCTKTEEKENVIAVTIPPQVEMVKRVVGDLYEVSPIIPAGMSVETYEISIQKFKEFLASPVYFTIGVPNEEISYIPLMKESTKVVHLENVKKESDLMLGEGRDPHIWLSPDRAIAMVGEICATMCELDPQNSEFYTENANEYIEEIKSAKEYAKGVLEGATKRDIIVYHPAFNYYLTEFGFNMIAMEKDGKEATAKWLSELVDFAKENGIKAVFYQAESSSKQAEIFANEIGGKAYELAPLSENYAENIKTMADIIASVNK